MQQSEIYALHGFLGKKTDWKQIQKALQDVKLHPIDVSSDRYGTPTSGLNAWAQAFNLSIPRGKKKRILMGYSLGGRLALHALLDNPSLWDGAVLISMNTGMKPGPEKEQRYKKDEEWAARFLAEPWEKLMEDWNRQPVFAGGDPDMQRKESEYSRKKLAEILVGWSIGKQDDLKPRLKQLPFPILWIAGERDAKYVAIANEAAALHSNSQIWIAPDAGHRVIWQQPEKFFVKVNKFLKDQS